ncbi:MAG TPA: hypothetical protein VIL20_17095 [Sandaracinaceae bacterium]
MVVEIVVSATFRIRGSRSGLPKRVAHPRIALWGARTRFAGAEAFRARQNAAAKRDRPFGRPESGLQISIARSSAQDRVRTF